MDKENVLQLLGNIKNRGNIGRTDIETVCNALSDGLILRTRFGNFILSNKGEKLLKSKINRKKLVAQ